jgi:hypothetical protein
MSSSSSACPPVFGLLSITALAVCIQGYHLGADDAAIYVPGIKKVADPDLYPFGAEFFQSHAHLTFFPNLIGESARLTRLPVDAVIFVWHVFGVFLLMLASWQLLCACFHNRSARWSGIALLAAVLSVPVAGTALAITDPYVTSRTLSTPATLFAIACFVSGKRKQAAAWWLFTALIHPQMSVYGAVFLGCLVLVDRRALMRLNAAKAEPAAALAYLSALPFLWELAPARGPAREALLSRTYFFVSRWTWYEWIGVFAPLALLWWMAAADWRGTKPQFRTVARTLVPFGLMFTVAGIVLTFPACLENYTRLQPMRSLHLVYVVFFLLLGGLIGEYVLRNRVWRWLALFVPLATGMFLMQIDNYPASAHVEWPGRGTTNPWGAAFLWIRHNTPKDAIFALNPDYMLSTGEEMHGFRAIAERSVLADAVKDSGAVSLFPALAERWQAQVQAARGWDRFQLSDFERVARQYAITWIVVPRPGPAGWVCPYENEAVAVCRLPSGGISAGESPVAADKEIEGEHSMSITPVSRVSPINQEPPTQTSSGKGASPSHPATDTVHLSPAALAHLKGGDVDHDGDRK